MYISEMRRLLRQFARNAGSSAVYPTEEVDRAGQAASDDFMRRTKLHRATMYFETDSDATFQSDLSSATGYDAAFRPEMVRRVYLTTTLTATPTSDAPDDLDVVSYGELSAIYAKNPSAGIPARVGFINETIMGMHPLPDADYRINIDHWLPEKTWTFGYRIQPVFAVTLAGGIVTAIDVTRGGGEFGGTAPTITASAGAATATAVLDAKSKQYIATVNVTAGGSEYATAPTFTTTLASADIELRCPTDLLTHVLMTRGASLLMQTTPESQSLLPMLEARYEEFVRRNLSANHDGARSFYRPTSADAVGRV